MEILWNIFKKLTSQNLQMLVQMDKFLALIEGWNQKKASKTPNNNENFLENSFFSKKKYLDVCNLDWANLKKNHFSNVQTYKRNHWNFIFTVIVSCGASVSENNTFFESEGEEKSHCSIQVCKASSSIVQVRRDSTK